MAEPAFWPSGLPQYPQQASYARSTGNNTVRTAMEFGPAKTRRRSSGQPSVISATYHLQERYRRKDIGETVNQKDIFLRFYEIVDCHASFWLPDPDDGSQYILVKIRASDEDQGVQLTYKALWLWSLTLSLEVHPLVPAKSRF